MEKSNFTLPELKAWDPVETRNFVLKMLDDKINKNTSILHEVKNSVKEPNGLFKSKLVEHPVHDYFTRFTLIDYSTDNEFALIRDVLSLFDFFTYKECFVKHISDVYGFNLHAVNNIYAPAILDEMKEKQVPRYDRIKLRVILLIVDQVYKGDIGQLSEQEHPLHVRVVNY